MNATITTERTYDFFVKGKLDYIILIFADGWKIAEISLSRMMALYNKRVKETGRFCQSAEDVAKQITEDEAKKDYYACWAQLTDKDKKLTENSKVDRLETASEKPCWVRMLISSCSIVSPHFVNNLDRKINQLYYQQ